MRRALLPILLLLAGPLAAQTTPRMSAVVEGGSVLLGDLFENAGPRAATPIGPAPLPGRRYVVEAPQLALIARDYGLDWRPLVGAERVVVERPGRAMRREEVIEPLRAELLALGAEADLDLDIPGFQPPMLPANAPEARVAVDGASYDAARKTFAANLVIVAEGMPTFRQRVLGRLVAMTDVVVATRALRGGDVVAAADVRIDRLPLDRLRGGVAEARAVVGQRLRRNVPAGQPVSAGDVVAVPVVARDAAVMLVVESPGLSLATPGRALEDGMRGGVIPVMNLGSGAVVLAEVLGPGRLRAIGPAPAHALRPETRARISTR
jgi:flagella basal body P-ring formation protein FlgA